MTNRRLKCKLITGGWIGDNKQQNFSIICYDICREINHHFNIKGIGKYGEYNEKELNKLVDLLNTLLDENKQLNDEKNIERGMELLK